VVLVRQVKVVTAAQVREPPQTLVQQVVAVRRRLGQTVRVQQAALVAQVHQHH
jgi:hypothetical protein